jgi:hypothetical protein
LPLTDLARRRNPQSIANQSNAGWGRLAVAEPTSAGTLSEYRANDIDRGVRSAERSDCEGAGAFCILIRGVLFNLLLQVVRAISVGCDFAFAETN